MKSALLVILCLTFSCGYAQKIHTVLYQYGSPGAWANYGLWTYNYNGSGSLSTITVQGWGPSANAWVNGYLITYTNNNNGTINYYVNQTWDSATSIWQNNNKVSYTYNALDQPLTALNQNWVSGTWQNYGLESSTYDGSDSLVNLQTQTWNAASNTWVNYEQITTTRNANETVNNSVVEIWDGSGWGSVGEETFTYNSSKDPITEIYQNLAGGAQNSNQALNSFDGNSHLTSSVQQVWNAASNSWVNSSMINYTNNSDESVHDYIVESWNTSGNFWQSSEMVTFDYLITTGISTQSILTTQIFPNPTNDIINLYIDDKDRSYELSLSDISGKELLHKYDNAGNQALNMTNLSSGIYFLKVIQGDKSSCQKIIKQ
jgi:hypothetical protein